MAMSTLRAEMREQGGRRYSTKIRKQGFIPGVIYGHNKATKPIKISETELQKFLNRYGYRSTVNINLNGQTIPAIIKEVQRHVIKENLLHIDFQQLSENEKVRIQVPIVLTGKQKVETSTTMVNQQLMMLEIQCLPKDMIKSISVDVSELKLGESITVKDLEIAKNGSIDVLNDSNEIVASLIPTANHEEPETDKDVPIYESDKSILDK